MNFRHMLLYLKKEASDYLILIKLLAKGKGSLSDYLLLITEVGVGVAIGIII